MGVTGTVIERYFRVDPDSGSILRRYSSRSNAERWAAAGYIKPGDAATGGGYRMVSIPGSRKPIRAHHLVWMWVHGEWPSGELDHEDSNRDNNSIGNLRRATVGENRTNKAIQSNNSSGFKWVYRDSQRPGTWRAEVTYRDKAGLKKRFRTSGHSTPDAAYEKASSFAKSAHGTFYNSGKRGE